MKKDKIIMLCTEYAGAYGFDVVDLRDIKTEEDLAFQIITDADKCIFYYPIVNIKKEKIMYHITMALLQLIDKLNRSNLKKI